MSMALEQVTDDDDVDLPHRDIRATYMTQLICLAGSESNPLAYSKKPHSFIFLDFSFMK